MIPEKQSGTCHYYGKPRASGDDPMYVNDAIGFRM